MIGDDANIRTQLAQVRQQEADMMSAEIDKLFDSHKNVRQEMEQNISELIEQKFTDLTERIQEQVITREKENTEIDEQLKDHIPEMSKLVVEQERQRLGDDEDL